MVLELGSLKRAVAAFKRALRVTSPSQAVQRTDDEAETLRAGVIQSFEFTYALCWKTMKRWMSDELGASRVEGIARRELCRLAAERGLLDDVDLWMAFHEARNQTSHTYDPLVAADVSAVAQSFAPKAQALCDILEWRNA